MSLINRASSSLENRVEGVNMANKYANEIRPMLVKVFEPYIGCKILKADGSLLASVLKWVPKMRNDNSLHVYRSSSAYSLAFVVKSCVSRDGRAYYHETYVHIGAIDGCVLRDVRDDGDELFKTDYSADEVAAARREYEAAEKAASEAESKLHPFGKYDR